VGNMKSDKFLAGLLILGFVLTLFGVGLFIGNYFEFKQNKPLHLEESGLVCNSNCIDVLKEGEGTYFHTILYEDKGDKGTYYTKFLNCEQIKRCCEVKNVK